MAHDTPGSGTDNPHKLSHTLLTKLLLLVLMLLCAENLARVWLSIQQAIQLPTLPTSLSPIYLATMSAAWAVGFAVCLFGISRLNPWAPRVTIVISVLFQANLWINRLAFGRSSEAFAVIGFRAMFSVLTLGLIISILIWPGTRRLFAQAKIYLDTTYNRPHA